MKYSISCAHKRAHHTCIIQCEQWQQCSSLSKARNVPLACLETHSNRAERRHAKWTTSPPDLNSRSFPFTHAPLHRKDPEPRPHALYTLLQRHSLCGLRPTERPDSRHCNLFYLIHNTTHVAVVRGGHYIGKNWGREKKTSRNISGNSYKNQISKAKQSSTQSHMQ